MKATELRQMTPQEIQERLTQEMDNLSRMRFQLTTSQLTNTALIRRTRKDIARMKTVLTERAKSGAAKES